MSFQVPVYIAFLLLSCLFLGLINLWITKDESKFKPSSVTLAFLGPLAGFGGIFLVCSLLGREDILNLAMANVIQVNIAVMSS